MTKRARVRKKKRDLGQILIWPRQLRMIRNFQTVAFEFSTTLVKKLLDIRKLDISFKDDMHFIFVDIYLYLTYN